MSVYDLKIKRLALLLLPAAWRKPLLAAFAQSLVQGANGTCGSFLRWRAEKQLRLGRNGQVCRLRGVLNDTFDPAERRIRVEDADTASGGADRQAVWLREEDRSLLVPRRGADASVILNRRGYGGASGYDFIVRLPEALRGQAPESRVAAVTGEYKLASKRFRIDYYNL